MAPRPVKPKRPKRPTAKVQSAAQHVASPHAKKVTAHKAAKARFTKTVG